MPWRGLMGYRSGVGAGVVFTTIAERHFRIRPPGDSEFPALIDRDGFLDSTMRVRSTLADAEPGDLVTLRAATEARVLVVLGEPGLGKTTALQTMREELAAGGAVVEWVVGADVSEVTFNDELAVHLGGVDGRAPLDVVILDGLDESPLVQRLHSRLARVLSSSASCPCLIIGCRSADVPPPLIDWLSRVFGDDVVIADLLPLRRSDAAALVSSLGLDGGAFERAVAERGVGSLASIPLTLELLANAFAADGSFNVSARELFDRGIMEMLDPPVSSGEVEQTTLSERAAVAGRAAAVMLLSGMRTIYTGRVLEAGSNDLPADEIAGGAENSPSGEIKVTKSLVHRTLATPLFGARGANRLAFVHASQAAYLAARYLVTREPHVPRRQLESLLLVAAPDGSRSVPIPLRELAAWLASMDPAIGEWLAKTDPESVLGHQAYLESDELREAVARALLARGSDFELGDRYWHTVNLAYPGLASELVEILKAVEPESPEWDELARSRVALRLARHVQSPALTTQLLAIAENPAWKPHLGAFAVEAAAQDPAAIEPLVALVRRLSDLEFARERDPDDEIKGHLLSTLWPDRIELLDVLPALHPRQSKLIGSYLVFLRQFAEGLPESHLPAALDWAATLASDSSPVGDGDDDLLDRPIGRLDSGLADVLVERAVANGDPALLRSAAVIVWPRLDRYEHPELPAALDEVSADASTDHRRRAFAEQLIWARPHADDARADVWHLVRGWSARRSWNDDRAHRSSLLDGSDFSWAVEKALAVSDLEPMVANAFAELARYLLNLNDPVAVEIAMSLEGTALWKHFSVYFDAVELDGEVANRMREAYFDTVETDTRDDAEPDPRAGLVDAVAEIFRATTDGDWSRFWELCTLLEYDPQTGHGRHHHTDRLAELPGATLLPTGWDEAILESARQFLAGEHDRADDWLGTERFDRRAWAGYLALSLLDERAELGEISDDTVSRWTGAILWFHSVVHESGDRNRKQRLIERAVTANPALMAQLLTRYVRGELRRNGGSPSEVQSFTPNCVTPIKEAWEQLVAELGGALSLPVGVTDKQSTFEDPLTRFSSDEEIGSARHYWRSMVTLFALTDSERAERYASGLAKLAADDAAARVAGEAIATVVQAAPDAWRRLGEIVVADATLGRRVAESISYRDEPWLGDFDETELAGIYEWLARLYPHADDPPIQSAGFVTEEMQARRLRDGVLNLISERASERALAVMADLHRRHPKQLLIHSQLLRTRARIFATAWDPPTAAEVLQLLADTRRRLVRSERELSQLVQEVLKAVEEDLIRNGQFLWDRLQADDSKLRPWMPKPEAALSAYLAHDLELRLHHRGIAALREVLVKPTDAYGAGDRLDILVEARPLPGGGLAASDFRVVIEVKCAWNDEVLTAQETQLVDRYLPETQSSVGIYVVGWYPLDLWNADDYRKRRIGTQTPDGLANTLLSQAARLAEFKGVDVTPIIVNIPRPATVATVV